MVSENAFRTEAHRPAEELALDVARRGNEFVQGDACFTPFSLRVSSALRGSHSYKGMQGEWGTENVREIEGTSPFFVNS
jgi:hypothetical protein